MVLSFTIRFVFVIGLVNFRVGCACYLFLLVSSGSDLNVSVGLLTIKIGTYWSLRDAEDLLVVLFSQLLAILPVLFSCFRASCYICALNSVARSKKEPSVVSRALIFIISSVGVAYSQPLRALGFLSRHTWEDNIRFSLTKGTILELANKLTLLIQNKAPFFNRTSQLKAQVYQEALIQ